MASAMWNSNLVTQLLRLWNSKECISTVVPSGSTYRLRAGTEVAVVAAGVGSAVAEVVVSVAAAGLASLQPAKTVARARERRTVLMRQL